MKRSIINWLAIGTLLVSWGTLSACSDEAGVGDTDGGTTGKNCGEHGTPHEDHCHCDQGYLYDGNTCVAPEQITEECVEHEEADAGADAEPVEHHHEACLCATDPCPCEEGTVQTLGGKQYCVPNLHQEE